MKKTKEKSGKKPRICFVLPSHPKYLIGGAEVQSYLIARELGKRNWEVHFTTQDFGHNTPEVEKDEGIIIHKFKRMRNLYGLLRKIDADIYYQMMLNDFTPITAYLAKRNKKKYVWACSSLDECCKDRCRSELRSNQANWFKKALFWPGAIVKDKLHNYGRSKADRIVVQAEYQRRLIGEKLGLECVVIKNAHPLPVKSYEKDIPPTMLSLGGIRREKQFELFIDLARRCQDLDCKFVIVGLPIDEKYLEELLYRMKNITNVKYLGRLDFGEANEVVGRASMLVNTSKYEGFPNTFIQAWMRETPVVSLNVDPDGIIEKNKLGFYSKTLDRLVEQVRFLIRNKETREKMGKNARRYAVREFNIENEIEKYERLLQELLIS